MDVRQVNWREIASEQLGPMLERQFFSTPQVTVARFRLRKGCIVPEHRHVNAQVAMVQQGSLKFRLPGGAAIVQAGESLYIPPGVPHSAEAVEDTVNIDIFSPPRTDWESGGDSYLRASK